MIKYLSLASFAVLITLSVITQVEAGERTKKTIKGAVVGAAVGSLIGGSDGAKTGAAIGAIAGNLKARK